MTTPASRYQFVAAPETLVPLGSDFRWRSRMVDYAQHPAYATFVKHSGLARRARALATYGVRLLPLLAKRVIYYEMIPGEYRNGGTVRSRLGFLGHAIRNALHLGHGKRNAAEPATADQPCSQQLQAGGVAVAVMPAERRDELLAQAEPWFRQLEEKRGRGANRREFAESRSSLDRTTAPELFKTIETIFEESGLSAAADAYLGRKAKLVDVNPQINDPSDSFWRDIFDDGANGALPRTAYFHRDASGGDLKVILYCSDVDDERGPFSYAVGSNHMRISPLDNLLCEANDHNGLSSTTREARATFAALPAKLRQKGAFGNDLRDDAPEAAAIMGSTWEITAPTGAIVAFDTKGIHRGGMVRHGERRVVTCVIC